MARFRPASRRARRPRRPGQRRAPRRRRALRAHRPAAARSPPPRQKESASLHDSPARGDAGVAWGRDGGAGGLPCLDALMAALPRAVAVLRARAAPPAGGALGGVVVEQEAAAVVAGDAPYTPRMCERRPWTRSALLYQQTSARAGGALRIRVGHAQVAHDADRLAFDAAQGDALDEGALGQEEQADHRQGHHHRGGHH